MFLRLHAKLTLIGEGKVAQISKFRQITVLAVGFSTPMTTVYSDHAEMWNSTPHVCSCTSIPTLHSPSCSLFFSPLLCLPFPVRPVPIFPLSYPSPFRLLSFLVCITSLPLSSPSHTCEHGGVDLVGLKPSD